MRGHPTDNPLIKDEPKTHFNRNSFIFVVGGTTGPGKALIEQMLHKNPNSYFMFAGTDMAGLRNSVRDFRKLSFMGDLDFVYIDREPKHCMIDYYFGRISCCAKLFAEMTGRHLEEVILIFADMDTVDPKRFSKLDVSTVTANHYDFNAGVVPILQAFIKMSTTHKIPMHFINMTTDYCMLRRPEFMQQMIQQRQLDLLLQCAYMEHSRTLARDMEYIQICGIKPIHDNKREMVRYGKAVLGILEKREKFGYKIEEIGKHLKSVLEEDVEGTDSLSFARRLYKALTSKTCDSLYGGKDGDRHESIEETIKKDQYTKSMPNSRRGSPGGSRKFHIGIISAYSKKECMKFTNEAPAINPILTQSWNTKHQSSSSDDSSDEEETPQERGRGAGRGTAMQRRRSGADILRRKPANVARSMSRPRAQSIRG